MNKKKVILIAGPTAVGKTAMAIAIARHYATEIISADSRQCYKELSIGVARPSPDELASVPHHFIASHSIHEEVNAAVFGQYALEIVTGLFEKHDKVVMVGGTGLYIKAFLEGLDDIPMIDPATRNHIVNGYEQNGMEWLQQQVRERDPAFYAAGEIHNPQRMMRALEVVEATGKSILSFRKGKKTPRDFDVIKIGLELPREELRERIDRRVIQMEQSGLVNEVSQLLPYRHLNALQTVGYSEIFDHLDEKVSLKEAIATIQASTRQYAKRQMTWFRRDKEMQWFPPSAVSQIINFIDQAEATD